jgi:hypothetical protein
VPILVPAHPLFGDGARAERAVWDVLRDQLPDDAVLFHSLRLQERQREFEADIVVLLPDAGWAVIEVKGGDVRRREGVWEQRQEGLWRTIDPVGQAQDCRHVLKRYLARHETQAQHSRAVHLVAFPDVDVNPEFESPGLPRSLVIDRKDLKTAVHQLSRAIDLHGDGTAPLSSAGTLEMLSLLSGPDLASEDIFGFMPQHEERVRQMTEDQIGMMAFLRNQHRVAVVGGAGSGKTWLALEQARGHLAVRPGEGWQFTHHSRSSPL